MDHGTLEIYGHIIGLNPLGHAHLVPFRDTMTQMKTVFDKTEVRLPKPHWGPGSLGNVARRLGIERNPAVNALLDVYRALVNLLQVLIWPFITLFGGVERRSGN